MRMERSLNDGPLAERLGDIGQLGDQLAGALARIEREFDAAHLFATRGALVAQRFQSAHATFVARAAGFDAPANPDFFLRPELVELAIDDVLGRELFALARFVRGEVAGIRTQQAAIQLDDARDDAIEKRAIVSDDDGRPAL